MKTIELDELKKLELDILKYVDDFCTSNNITYFLCGGTMLGAMRHDGFIPWDDDIDIMMPRPDYCKFIELFNNEGHYKLVNPYKDKNYNAPYSIINDERTFRRAGRKIAYNVGVNIDVFPIDGLPENYNETLDFFKKLKFKYEWLSAGICKFGKGKTLVSTCKRNGAILLFRFLAFLGLVSENNLAKDIDKFAQTYSYENCEFVGITTISHYGDKEKNVKTDYFPIIKKQFEDAYFNIPSNYHMYLTQLYGDYMKIPPKDKQITHHDAEYFWK